MTTWLVSDVHLSVERPAVTQAFCYWLQQTVTGADALYLLGDIFEVWLGDDVLGHPQLAAAMPEVARVVAALRALSDAGTQVYAMHGNRDFLLGAQFANACGLQLLPDPTLIFLSGQRVLLSHGDALCTEDTAYQAFRCTVRDPQWQHAFLAQPVDQRQAYAAQARAQSRYNKTTQVMEIMDVHPDAVAEVLRAHAYPQVLLHGHTHRPAIHHGMVDGHAFERIVLGDWHAQAVVCRATPTALQLETLTLSAETLG